MKSFLPFIKVKNFSSQIGALTARLSCHNKMFVEIIFQAYKL